MSGPAAADGPRTETDGERRSRQALEASGIPFELVRHGRVASLEEAARVRGVSPEQIVKSIVVRRGEGDFLFVLVPGGRTIAWPRLRALLGVTRLSMPDKDVARDVTGYERGTITPFGSTTPWPVVADLRVAGKVSVGAGGHGVAATLDGAEMVRVLGAQVADVTDPEPSG
ncbi:YbaK/EbsC family protein [Isoptericola sp. NEAU-Y5]|uniref:YbaK/EbsC family protein n=1 Tax=Isoptericola luteus TaxID=2879484 RepID=A0ABS7Z9P5_9MICO|nr:YbaK/EbsC family protein [Isoptericola sp. NEAU-Y5]MCA5891773.1 YbaK/EbsC family protein [Isoptericola sp. NEAU-Y5]MCA5894606.1 YbaK/EbsC family protein [Isoptericola sp. NEAU-Y5]